MTLIKTQILSSNKMKRMFLILLLFTLFFCKAQQTLAKKCQFLICCLEKNHILSDGTLAPGLGLFACLASIKQMNHLQ